MNKIGLELFTSDIPQSNKPLDIETIVNGYKENRDDDIKNNIHLILKNNQLRRKKLISIYTELFDKCIQKIHQGIKTNRSDIVFMVPKIVFRCDLYNYQECMTFIQKK